MANSSGGTAFIFINAYWGNISTNTFQNNQMLGGSAVGYSVYSTSNASGGCASGTTSCVTTGTVYKDNVISKGAYGYVYPAGAPSRTAIQRVLKQQRRGFGRRSPAPLVRRVAVGMARIDASRAPRRPSARAPAGRRNRAGVHPPVERERTSTTLGGGAVGPQFTGATQAGALRPGETARATKAPRRSGCAR